MWSASRPWAKTRMPTARRRSRPRRWRAENHEVHGVHVEGPYVNGDQFTVRFKMDITLKETGDRNSMDETDLYTMKDGKIAEERFLYAS